MARRLGAGFIVFSRSFADSCYVPAPQGKRQSMFWIYLGLGDSYLALLYRWLTMCVVGLAPICVGIGVLVGEIPAS